MKVISYYIWLQNKNKSLLKDVKEKLRMITIDWLMMKQKIRIDLSGARWMSEVQSRRKRQINQHQVSIEGENIDMLSYLFVCWAESLWRTMGGDWWPWTLQFDRNATCMCTQRHVNSFTETEVLYWIDLKIWYFISDFYDARISQQMNEDKWLSSRISNWTFVLIVNRVLRMDFLVFEPRLSLR